jgi:hypothetical protein
MYFLFSSRSAIVGMTYIFKFIDFFLAIYILFGINTKFKNHGPEHFVYVIH